MTFFKDPRAYLEGLGTTTLLVVGAIVVLVIASSIVGFSDWGAANRNADVEELVIEDARPDADTLDRAALAARAARRAAPSAGAGGGARRAAGGDGSSETADSASRPRTGSEPFQGGSPVARGGLQPASVDRPPPTSPAPAPAGGGGLRDITKAVGDTTDSVGGNVGRTVGEIDPALGGAVEDTAGMLGDVLRGPGAL